MGDFKGFLTVSPPPSPSPSDNSRLAILCYGLVVVGTAAIVLAVYSLIIIKRRGRRHLQSQPIRLVEVVTASSSTENSQTSFLSSFKYKKEAAEKENGVGGDDDYECPVCLSAYEEGEEVRKLPRCKHCFHAPCIDMWLHSHFDCPICRTPVRTFCHIPPENSRHRLVESGGVSV